MTPISSGLAANITQVSMGSASLNGMCRISFLSFNYETSFTRHARPIRNNGELVTSAAAVEDWWPRIRCGAVQSMADTIRDSHVSRSNNTPIW